MKETTAALDVFTRRALQVIQAIPEGKVLTYGRAALLAGNPKGARQISRRLHSIRKQWPEGWKGDGAMEELNTWIPIWNLFFTSRAETCQNFKNQFL